MIRRLVVYGFPLVFVGIELLLRSILNAGQDFVAPTLASAGIGQLFPLVALKDRTALLPASTRASLRAKGFSLVSNADRRVTSVAWLSIFLLTILWAVLLYLSIKTAPNTESLFLGYKIWLVGLGTYFVGVVLAEIKEWV